MTSSSGFPSSVRSRPKALCLRCCRIPDITCLSLV
uniref:Uncharacterized protein n=1 Tax=Rhizophora mucronata TaxID=61149 RepID=A0A2P2P1K4_RHIMU